MQTDLRSVLGLMWTELFSLDYLNKKQTCVSLNTTEAETASCVLGLRAIGLPALTLWSRILQRELVLDLFQDNQATMRVLITELYPQMRHISRTHGVSLS